MKYIPKDTECFKYFNANPKGKITADCYLRAISTALNIHYHQVAREMLELSFKKGYAINDCRLIRFYIESKGWVKHKQPRFKDNSKMTGKEFCTYLNRNETGNVIANIGSKHIVAVIPDNGAYKINDTWNSSSKCVGNYWTKS